VDEGEKKCGFEINIPDTVEEGICGDVIVKPELVDYLLEEREFSLRSASGLPREFVERVVDYLHCCIGFTGTKDNPRLTCRI
jgi:hypothetical protein